MGFLRAAGHRFGIASELCSFFEAISAFVRQDPDGSFSLDMDYFCFHHSTDRTFNRRLVDLFGEPRPPEMLFFTAESGFLQSLICSWDYLEDRSHAQ